MDLLLAVLDVLTSGRGWRGIFCLVVSIMIACVVGHYGVAVGVYWDRRAD